MNNDTLKNNNHSESVALVALLTIGSMEARQGKYCTPQELKERLKKRFDSQR